MSKVIGSQLKLKSLFRFLASAKRLVQKNVKSQRENQNNVSTNLRQRHHYPSVINQKIQPVVISAEVIHKSSNTLQVGKVQLLNFHAVLNTVKFESLLLLFQIVDHLLSRAFASRSASAS